MILALDPGQTTGWASMPVDNALLISGEFNEPLEVYDELIHARPHVIVCESFLFRQKTKINFTPVEVIGTVKLYCYHKDVPLVMQTPAQAKHYYTDKRLKDNELYTKGKPHANDAMRHLLYYLNFGKGKDGR